MGLTGSPAQPKTNKFTSRNLNAMTRAPSNREARYGGGGRLLVLGKPQPAKAAVVAPSPVNTPSLRRENKGQDLSIKLVPSGGGGWAHPGDSTPEDEPKQHRTPQQGSTAPWAKVQPASPSPPPEQQPSPVPREDVVEEEQDRPRHEVDERREDESSAQQQQQQQQHGVEEEGGESQTEYMRRLAADARELRRSKEEADMAAQRARAADRLARLEAQRKAPAAPASAPTAAAVRDDKSPDAGNRWQRGLSVPTQQQPSTANRANSPNPSEAYLMQYSNEGRARRDEQSADKPSFSSLFTPETTTHVDDTRTRGDEVVQQEARGPVLSVSADGYTRGRTGDEQKPKLYDPKTGSMVDIGESRTKALRIISDDNRRRGGHASSKANVASEPATKPHGAVDGEKRAASTKSTPLVLLRPPQQQQQPQQQQKKQQKKTPAAAAREADDDENVPSGSGGARDEEERRAKRRAEKLARGPRTKGALYAYASDGSVVCVDGDKQGRGGGRGRRSRKKNQAQKNAQEPNPSSDREVAAQGKEESSLGPVGPKSTEPVGGRAPARPSKRGAAAAAAGSKSEPESHSLGGPYFGLQSALAVSGGGGGNAGSSSTWNEPAAFSAFSSGGPDGSLSGGAHPMSWGFDPISQLNASGTSSTREAAAPVPSSAFGSSLLQSSEPSSTTTPADGDDRQPSPLVWSG